MVTKSLLVKLVPKPGKETAVEEILKGGASLVSQEPFTKTWYALKFADGSYGIFDSFEGDEGRDAHLNGKVADALMANAAELFSVAPQIDKVEVIAVK